MASSTSPQLERTPFHAFHAKRGAKMVDFAGWEMPLLYDSIRQEHLQVRRSGGLFDVSHMGRLRFLGRDATRFLDRVCSRQIHGMADGQARYSLVCNDQGGCRDDVLVYRQSGSEYLMVCNAANRAKLLEHFGQTRGDLVFKLQDETASTAMIAIQGPKVMELLGAFSREIPELKRYRFVIKHLLIARLLVARTGYTGEDGVEVILPAAFASQALGLFLRNVDLEADDATLMPAGLGARDTLRLEAGMPLYGHELTEELDPISAGLTFAITLGKGDDDPEVERFIGQDALRRIAETGPVRRLVGLVLDGKRIARPGMTVKRGDAATGFVTSGCASPTLERSIAMAYVDSEHAEPGGTVQVDLERAVVDAEVVKLPFYKS